MQPAPCRLSSAWKHSDNPNSGLGLQKLDTAPSRRWRFASSFCREQCLLGSSTVVIRRGSLRCLAHGSLRRIMHPLRKRSRTAGLPVPNISSRPWARESEICRCWDASVAMSLELARTTCSTHGTKHQTTSYGFSTRRYPKKWFSQVQAS